MAVETKGIFTKIDNMLMEPLTKTMGKTIAYRYCALAAQAKHLHTFCITFMATLCHCHRFIITGYKKPITEHNLKIVLKPCKTERKKGKY
ncbi:hypothetical protein [Bartonella saheliensis]|uniref:hypothetical protein n=1 Tax=Bartonella saheliensis TaxID=1457016 RepID=UPI0011AAF148|nr:hypothetical protein [Bartonella saheliensis]